MFICQMLITEESPSVTAIQQRRHGRVRSGCNLGSFKDPKLHRALPLQLAFYHAREISKSQFALYHLSVTLDVMWSLFCFLKTRTGILILPILPSTWYQNLENDQQLHMFRLCFQVEFVLLSFIVMKILNFIFFWFNFINPAKQLQHCIECSVVPSTQAKQRTYRKLVQRIYSHPLFLIYQTSVQIQCLISRFVCVRMHKEGMSFYSNKCIKTGNVRKTGKFDQQYPPTPQTTPVCSKTILLQVLKNK